MYDKFFKFSIKKYDIVQKKEKYMFGIFYSKIHILVII